ncbi:MAG: GNAT family N-acetyltransferase [Propionibacteriales bacterium]|nr:GNAT family N-acetyltransferase [Propionibacteriales bacterium]
MDVPTRLVLRRTAYDHPHVTAMVEQVQDEYRRIYQDEGDTSPTAPADFVAPRGYFVVGYAGGEPVAMGGWRRLEPGYGGPGRRPAEIKRMYVVPAGRGRGWSRVVLADLEHSARAASVDWLVLETGDQQPAALVLYRSAGYGPVPRFGHYAAYDDAVHLGKHLTGQPDGHPSTARQPTHGGANRVGS